MNNKYSQAAGVIIGVVGYFVFVVWLVILISQK